jgi:hypothetical protein
MILYNNDKWLDIWDNDKYTQIRNKILNTFNELVFVEEGHRYFVGDRELFSVSVVTHIFKKHFDSITESKKTSERNWDNPKSKYYRMTPEEILAQWKKKSEDACSKGTERHEFGESCFYYMTGQYDKILPAFKDRLTSDGGFESKYPEEDAVVKMYQDMPKSMVPILAETKVYDANLGYAGTFDILFYYDAEIDGRSAEDSGLVVWDFKTNEDLFKNFKEEKLLPPFNELLDMPLSLYILQLSLYQICLENIGFIVKGRRIVWLKPTGVYDKIGLHEFTQTLRKRLSEIDIKEHIHQ